MHLITLTSFLLLNAVNVFSLLQVCKDDMAKIANLHEKNCNRDFCGITAQTHRRAGCQRYGVCRGDGVSEEGCYEREDIRARMLATMKCMRSFNGDETTNKVQWKLCSNVCFIFVF